MTPPNRGGFADYDDPDFDSEWFDDEAYDRALEGGYEEEPPARGSSGAEGRQPAKAPSQAVAAGRARPEVGMRAALVPALLTLTAVVLAVGAGFYVVVRAADSGSGGPLAEAGRRVQAALAVLRGQPAPGVPAPTSQPIPGEEPSPAGDGPASATAPGPWVEPQSMGSSPMVAAVASAAGPGPAPVASRVGSASAPIAAQPTPVRPTDAPGRQVVASPVVPPPRPVATATPRLPVAAPSAKAVQPTPSRSAPVASPVPTPAPTRPAPAKPPVPAPTLRPVGQVAAPPPAAPAPARPGAAHTSLLFEPNVVVPSGAHVEQLWRFTSAQGARPGTLLVTARVGFGRFAPALAQRRGTEVATLLRRNTAGAAWRVELRVDRQVTRGIAGRQVDVDFVPSP